MNAIRIFLPLLISILSSICFAKTNETKLLVCENGAIHRFFDTSPISPSGKYIALFRLPFENRQPNAGECGEVVVIDIEKMREVATVKTRGWEMQLGANVQWGTTDADLFFNDVDPSTWEDFAVKFDFKTGKKERIDGTVFMVSPDGKKLASYNLKKSRYAQEGYGVIVPDSQAKKNIGIVDNDGVYITDIASNKTEIIASIRDIYEKTTPSIKVDNPNLYEYYCFQVKWNPQGTRLLTTIQWTPTKGGKRKRAVITMKPDGSNLRTAITPGQWSKGGHHINWMPDGEHLSMNLNIDGKKGLEIVSVKYDGSGLKQIYPIGSGHPSLHPKFPYILTDAYPSELPLDDGRTPLRLINIKKQTERMLAKLSLPPIKKQRTVFRVDAHPVWDSTGRRIVFNDTRNGKRCVYIMNAAFDDDSEN